MTAYKQLIRTFFSEAVGVIRRRKGMTQEEMAEKMRISCRAYGDLERGKYSFSTIALIFFLLMMDSGEIIELLEAFLKKVKEMEMRDAA